MEYTPILSKKQMRYEVGYGGADKLAANIKPLLDENVTDIIIRKQSIKDGAPFIDYARVLIEPTKDTVDKTDTVIIDDMEVILGYDRGSVIT